MVLAAEIDYQRVDVQFSPIVVWSGVARVAWRPSAVPETSPVRVMYARLAREYDAMPVEADRIGGAAGDLYDF